MKPPSREMRFALRARNGTARALQSSSIRGAPSPRVSKTPRITTGERSSGSRDERSGGCPPLSWALRASSARRASRAGSVACSQTNPKTNSTSASSVSKMAANSEAPRPPQARLANMARRSTQRPCRAAAQAASETNNRAGRSAAATWMKGTSAARTPLARPRLAKPEPKRVCPTTRTRACAKASQPQAVSRSGCAGASLEGTPTGPGQGETKADAEQEHAADQEFGLQGVLSAASHARTAGERQQGGKADTDERGQHAEGHGQNCNQLAHPASHPNGYYQYAGPRRELLRPGRGQRPSSQRRIRIAACLSSGWLKLPHLGLCTQLGQPSVHGTALHEFQRGRPQFGQQLEALLGNAHAARETRHR